MLDFDKRLKTRGYRLTPQRRAVYEVLVENAGRPMKPEEISATCSERGAAVGMATVYRALELFCELGMARHVHLHESASYYELLDEDEHHHHLVCVGCGAIRPVEACLVGDMEKLIRDDYDFLVTSHCLSLFGYCPDCLPRGR